MGKRKGVVIAKDLEQVSKKNNNNTNNNKQFYEIRIIISTLYR